MQRKDHLIKIVLSSLEGSDRPRSELTNRIKNYEKEARAEAIAELLADGLIEFYPGESCKGRRPLIAKITADGLRKLKQLSDVFKERSVWSV